VGDDLDALLAEAGAWAGRIDSTRGRRCLEALAAAVRALREELADARGEINRHHADFVRWEQMAADGAGLRAERDRLAAALRDAQELLREVIDESTIVAADVEPGSWWHRVQRTLVDSPEEQEADRNFGDHGEALSGEH
jgi:hypothetical protein